MSSDTYSQNEKSLLAAEFEGLAKEFEIKTFQKTGMSIVAVDLGGSSDEIMFKKGELVYKDGEWTDINELLDKQPIEKKEPEQPIKRVTSLTDYVDMMMHQNLSSAASMSAFASRLSFRLDRLYTEEENAIAALSRIEDIDMVHEIVEFVKERILAECSLAMAAQANALPEHVLFLLESLPSADKAG